MMIDETIGHTQGKGPRNTILRKNGNRAEATERAQIVQSAYMVVMLVGDKHGVYLFERHAKRLCPEVGAAIDEDAGIFRLHKSGSTQPPVSGVVRSTDSASTADLGYACRCSASQYPDFHSSSNKVYLRMNFDSELFEDGNPYGIRKCHDIAPACPAEVDQHQRLFIVHSHRSQRFSFPAAAIDHPTRRNLHPSVFQVVVRHLRIFLLQAFQFLTPYDRIHKRSEEHTSEL